MRRFLFSVVDDKRFEGLTMAMILVSSLSMAVESPQTMTIDAVVKTLYAIDIVSTSYFALELAMKVIVLGFALDEFSYLREPWNILDGGVVMLSILALALANSGFTWVRALRTLRVLRPLRVISRIPQLKVVVNTVFQSTPMLGNVVAIASVFFLIFGILGMRLFMGKFHWCTDPEIESRWECTGSFSQDVTVPRAWNETAGSCNDARVFREQDCLGVFNTTQELPRYWQNEDHNFDNIGNAMLTLFVMASGDSWVDVMWSGVDARGTDLAKARDHNLPAAAFFIVFMVIGMFFFVNLFVGIMVMSFQTQQEQQREVEGTASAGPGGSMMTNEQKAWVRAKKILRTAKPVARRDLPSSFPRRVAYNVMRNPIFDWVISGSIVANVILLACEYEGMADAYAEGLDTGNMVFTIIFALEAFVKISALFPREYFKNKWNVFDFTVARGATSFASRRLLGCDHTLCTCASACLVPVQMTSRRPQVFASIIAMAAGVGGFASVLRILRMLRLFKLAKSLKGAFFSRAVPPLLPNSPPAACRSWALTGRPPQPPPLRPRPPIQHGDQLAAVPHQRRRAPAAPLLRLRRPRREPLRQSQARPRAPRSSPPSPPTAPRRRPLPPRPPPPLAPPPRRPGEALTNHKNFHNFGQAMLLLVTLCTGEDWSQLMNDCSVQTDCDHSLDCDFGTCCGSDGAALYFGSFYVLVRGARGALVGQAGGEDVGAT